MNMIYRKLNPTFILVVLATLFLHTCSPNGEVVQEVGETPDILDSEFRPTDPSSVILATGKPQLVEIYSRY